ncbi:MAG: hypothetical protein HKN00_02555 [Flavobacteriaceae bacterium]|nr:hypothetical protein [Bacteroidia bacterium]MBT8287403.1 hypothetical protein [Bacteroidia bacterium]NNF74038.1 hypothetical protein [Flavobacteriaceae bacterium]NNK74126.1 hypothetical protein [Flavobacteriaceae bacterium]
MSNSDKNKNNISRRAILPILGTSFLIPLFGFGQSELETEPDKEDEDYEILLKPDGTTVKVKRSALKKSKVVKKGLSNKSLLNWLGKKK